MSDTPSLQTQLRDRYQIEEWRKILHGIFPDGTVKFFSTPQAIKASQEFVKSTLQLGTIDLPDGKTIALLEVETSDQVKLARNRVGLRNFVANFIDEAGASAVLAVFHQANSDDWRLTYAARQTTLDEDTFEITTIETAPRRFTFLLGKSEPCRTATSRLATLSERGDDMNLADIEKAFSVETLSKDFFKKYKIHYQAFVDHLLSPSFADETREVFEIEERDDPKEQDKVDKPIRDFVKTLLGRLVFLHFLQKKGWLGCKAGGKAWKGGEAEFLQTFLTLAKAKGEDALFHSKYLCPLFHEALNTPERPGDIFPLTNSRLPYLNGGLFEENSGVMRSLDFPPELFGNLLDFFGEYNFTIDENDPEDHEVGIDPEMLGHIFENLLEDNKDKGAFYTPKAIVSYMSRQSLLHYLQTHLGENKELETLLNEKDYTKHEAEDSFVAANRDKIAELLDDVKICDPAIGSGAFPIGLLQEILWTRLALQPGLNTPQDRARLKRQIIQHSIHGVDIDPGAIEIARLRFWLALVVDEDKPRPLPNLDYKIHRADSLIEYIRGEPVNLGTEPPKDAAAKAAVEKLIAAKKDLFSAKTTEDKRNAWFDLYRALAQLAQAEFTWMRNELGLFGSDMEKVSQLDRGVKEFGQWIGLIDAVKKEKVHMQETLLERLKRWFDDPLKPTFLWNLHFGEIFVKGGFDVVIANPPYISVERFAGTPVQEFWRNKFKLTYASRSDVYALFYDQGLSILKRGGCLSYISSNKFQRSGYGAPLRGVLSSWELKEIIDFCELPVFEAATDPIIVILNKNNGSDWAKDAKAVVIKETEEFFRLAKTLEERGMPVAKDSLGAGVWSIGVAAEAKLLGKLKGGGIPLSEFIGGKRNIMAGIKTGLNKAFWIDSDQYSSLKGISGEAEMGLLKPLIVGDDARRWVSKPVSKYIIYTPRGTSESKLGKLRSHLLQFKDRLENRALDQEWYELQQAQLRFSATYSNPKIIYPDIGMSCRFSLDLSGRYPDMTCFSIPQVEIHLLSILNSSMSWFFMSRTAAVLGDASSGGRLRFKAQYLAPLPIPRANETEKARLAELSKSCAAAAKNNDTTSLSVLEAEINKIVYRLFNLTPEEIALIESSLPS